MTGYVRQYLEESLRRLNGQVRAPDPALTAQAHAHLDTLTKPLGSLGQLEDIAAQLFALRRGAIEAPLRKAVYVLAADHGIAAEGVSAYPSEVTRQMVLNFLGGGAAINVLARLHGADVRIVDVGVAGEFEAHAGLLQRKVRAGSRNMLHEAAMSWDELSQAFATGLALADDAATAGFDVLAAGEMGIGNTTAASALTAALTGAAPELVTGHGTGVSSGAYAHKLRVVHAVLAKHLAETEGPLDTFRRLGGLEIAAMTGLVLGAAARGIAVVADGFISTVAAAYAVALVPTVRHFLFAGHRSEEPGHQVLLAHLALRPILQLNMRLGEGTGAVLAMPILESAQRIFCEMATFSTAGVSEARS